MVLELGLKLKKKLDQNFFNEKYFAFKILLIFLLYSKKLNAGFNSVF